MLVAKKKLIRDISTDENDFIFTINTALGTGDSFQLPLPSGQTYNFEVFWGDGNSDIITVYNQTETLHTYSSGGVYQVSISGKCGGWSFNNGGDKLKITSVDQWGNVGFDYLTSGFKGTTNLISLASDGIKGTPNLIDLTDCFMDSGVTSIPSNLISLLNNVSIVRAMFRGGKFSTLPNDFFRYNTNIVDFSFLFYLNFSIISIPIDVFRYNVLANDFSYTFSVCTAFKNPPEDLFYYNPLVTKYTNTFALCRNIICPTRIFNTGYLSIVTSFTNFMNVNNIIYSFTGTVQDVWNYATGATSTNAFLNQTALSNYASIPNSWKGL